MTNVSLKCSCGQVKGVASNISADAGTRIICYCDDCQAFANWLGSAGLNSTDEILDENGGTDIFQITPSQLKITQGVEQIRCLRLSAKGMFRWYTHCCQTPIGNTLTAGFPFVGVIHNFMDNADSRDADLGPVRAHVHVKFTKIALPDELKKSGSPYRALMRSLSKMLVWKLKGRNKPSPFFDAHGDPVSEPININSRAEK